MKRSTAPWITAIAATALMVVPVAGWAQEPAPSTPRPSTEQPAADRSQPDPAQEHLRQAKEALKDIPAASLTGTTKNRITELTNHLSTLEQASAPADARKTVAEMDRILTELIGTENTTGAPTAVGTSGRTGANAPRATETRPAADVTLDEATRAKLMEVRAHITAFAASMGGAMAPTPKSEDTPAASAAPSANPATPTEPAAAQPDPASAAAQNPTPNPPAQNPPAQNPPAQSPTPEQNPASPQPTPPASAAQGAAPSGQVDPETVKRHLTAARNSLSQLTQLPQAAQLTGDARAQVAQLISNFNELITTNTNWRASFDKVQANLTSLIGDQKAATTAESAAAAAAPPAAQPATPPAAQPETPPAAPPAGAPEAVGTSGTMTIDPAIRQKLVEFRAHLAEFEKAASGAK